MKSTQKKEKDVTCWKKMATEVSEGTNGKPSMHSEEQTQ